MTPKGDGMPPQEQESPYMQKHPFVPYTGSMKVSAGTDCCSICGNSPDLHRKPSPAVEEGPAGGVPSIDWTGGNHARMESLLSLEDQLEKSIELAERYSDEARHAYQRGEKAMRERAAQVAERFYAATGDEIAAEIRGLSLT